MPFFIKFLKLRCFVIRNHRNYTILVLVQVLKVLVNSRVITPTVWIEANCIDTLKLHSL